MLTILSNLSLVDVDSKMYSGSVQGVESIAKQASPFTAHGLVVCI